MKPSVPPSMCWPGTGTSNPARYRLTCHYQADEPGQIRPMGIVRGVVSQPNGLGHHCLDRRRDTGLPICDISGLVSRPISVRLEQCRVPPESAATPNAPARIARISTRCSMPGTRSARSARWSTAGPGSFRCCTRGWATASCCTVRPAPEPCGTSRPVRRRPCASPTSMAGSTRTRCSTPAPTTGRPSSIRTWWSSPARRPPAH